MARAARKREIVEEVGPRVVYTQAPLALGRVREERAGAWLVRMGDREVELAHDPCVDPEVLRECIRDGAAVLVDASGAAPVIVGAVVSRRSVAIDREGNVEARVKRFEVRAERALIATHHAFVQILPEEVEVYGTRVITKAREIAKVLARMISLN